MQINEGSVLIIRKRDGTSCDSRLLHNDLWQNISLPKIYAFSKQIDIFMIRSSGKLVAWWVHYGSK